MRKILISLIVLTFMVIYTVYYLDLNQIAAFFNGAADTAVLQSMEISKTVLGLLLQPTSALI